MQVSQSTLILGAVVLAAGAFAFGRETAPSDTPVVQLAHPAQPEDSPPEGVEPAMPGTTGVHASPMGTGDLPADDEPAAIEWTVPAAWHTMPNPSSMRLATYSVPRAPGDPADADVSVTRAGGDTASNIERWTGQFAGAEPPKPSVHTAHGLEVTVVEIQGVYTNGMSPGAKPQPGWALLAAIVKTPGMPYFFKMTGPAATVHAARGAFTAMIDGIHSAG
jgi:hypothetical protein